MAVVSDQNLAAYKSTLDDLQTEINSWSKYLSIASETLNKGIGSTFRTQYSIGKKATANIQSIIDILQSLQGDLNKLIEDANTFYKKSANASKK